MLSLFTKQQGEILTALKSAAIFENNSTFIRIEGEFGSGKTTFLDRILKILKDDKSAAAIFHLQKPSAATISDLPLAILNSKKYTETPYASLKTTESEFIKMKFDDKLISLNENNEEEAKELLRVSRLCSYSEYRLSFSNIKTNSESYDSEFNTSFFDSHISDIAVEALIIDLINYFYPNLNKEPDFNDFLRKVTPKKVIIAIDEYDSIAAGVDDFILNGLLSYSSKKFSDFIAYDSIVENNDAKVLDFIDLKIITSSRNSIDNIFPEASRDKVTIIKLSKLSDESLEIILKSRILKQPMSLDELINLSRRNLLSAVTIVHNLSSAQNIDLADQFKISYESIVKGLLHHEIEWLHAFSFMPLINETYLKFFSQTKGDIEYIIPYSRRSPMVQLQDGGDCAIDEDVRFFIRGYLQYNNHSIYDSLHNIEIYYKELPNELFYLQPDQWELLTALAYFEKLNREYCLPLLFDGKLDAANRLINNLQEYFISYNHTIAIKDEIRRTILLIAKNGNPEAYYHNVEILNTIWLEYERNMSVQEETIQNDVSEKYNRLDSLKSARIKAEEEHKKAQEEYTKLENIEMQKEEARFDYSTSKKIKPGKTPVLIFILFFLLAVFSQEVFGKFIESSATIDKLNSIMYIFTALSGIYLVWVFIRAALLGEGQKKFDVLTRQAQKVQQDKQERFLAIQNNKAEMESLGIELAEMQRILQDLENQLSIIQEKKKEAFI